ncbi:MAG TPA: S8 family serine peptidase [Pirellulales bacterium]|jgi:subtilisin family serine protease|nr:S8 family serine peptidase [Pirellulales bacterium]
MFGRKRAGQPSSAKLCAASQRVELALEQLEELLLLSTTPAATPADWRQETFSIGSPDQQVYGQQVYGQQVYGQQVSGAASAQALGDSALPLIGGGQEQQQFGYTGAGYSVAILDTGIDYNNPAFAGHYLTGWNFVSNNGNPMDDNGHGTHVAGIIASNDPNHPGVAPGVGIISLKVLDSSGTGTFGNIDLGLQWVAAHQQQYHIAAVNMSLGAGNFSTEPWTMLDSDLQTLRDEGVFVAASSGNSYFSYGSQEGLAFPAINNLVASVGAVWNGSYGSVTWASGAEDYTTTADQITSFTQRGPQLDILAPGAFITSTYLNDTWATMAGTSMASPVVAGAALDILQALVATGHTSQATPEGILSIMQSTGVSIVDQGHGQDNVNHTGLTFKRLDLFNAIQSIAAMNGNPSNPPGQNDAAANFVNAIYHEVLGRTADPAGLSSWTALLGSGLSRFQFAQILWDSAEHRTQQIEADYSEFLHRSAGAGEVSGWLTAFLQGASETSVASTFLHSAEFLHSDPDNVTFIQTVFQDLLGRAVDPASLTSFENNLNAGLTRSQLVDLVLGSPERTAHVIGQYYQQFLGRPGSATEVQNWVGMIASGQVDFESVAELFLSSNEFFGAASAGVQSALLSQLDNLQALVASADDTGSVSDAQPVSGYLPVGRVDASPPVQIVGSGEGEFTD